MPRTILHLDLDAFFCSAEELRDSSLRGKPFAEGGRRQVELWGQGRASAEKARKVQESLDELQEKFGKKIIDRGR